MTAGWSILYIFVVFTWIGGLPTLWVLLGREAPRLLAVASAELHPFMPYVYLLNLAIATWGDPPGDRWFNYASTGLAIAGWFMNRDHDDRWKRRRKRLGDRVKSLGHRLVTASDGAA